MVRKNRVTNKIWLDIYQIRINAQYAKMHFESYTTIQYPPTEIINYSLTKYTNISGKKLYRLK